MKVTAEGIIRATGIAAMLAGALFVLVQVIHPAETVAAVAGDGWVPVHYLTIAMLTLFTIGVTGIYARQVEKVGWIGLIGFVALSFGLLLNIGGAFVEAFVEPLLAISSPNFVDAFNAMVMGTPYDYDLGAIPTMWSASSVMLPVRSADGSVAVTLLKYAPNGQPRMHMLRAWQVPRCGLCASGAVRLAVRPMMSLRPIF